MAALQPAVDRIKGLITNQRPRPTPLTITGNKDIIRSYGLVIAWKGEGDHWFITTQRNSPTTNRHIQAAYAAIYQLGYAPLPENEQPRDDAIKYGKVG